jgi:hypothetical protein
MPMYSSKPQRLGSGSTTRYIEMDIVPTTNRTVHNVSELLVQKDEFINNASRYNYVRIRKAMVVVPPNSSNGEILIRAVYTDEADIDDIDNNDSTKRVMIHTVHKRTRTFLPPHLPYTFNYVQTTVTKSATIQLDDFNFTDVIYLPSIGSASAQVLYPLRIITKLTNQVSDLKCRIVCVCDFKGEKFNSDINNFVRYRNDPILKQRIEELKLGKNKKFDTSVSSIEKSFESFKSDSDYISEAVYKEDEQKKYFIYLLNEQLEADGVEQIDVEQGKNMSLRALMKLFLDNMDQDFRKSILSNIFDLLKRIKIKREDLDVYDAIKNKYDEIMYGSFNKSFSLRKKKNKEYEEEELKKVNDTLEKKIILDRKKIEQMKKEYEDQKRELEEMEKRRLKRVEENKKLQLVGDKKFGDVIVDIKKEIDRCIGSENYLAWRSELSSLGLGKFTEWRGNKFGSNNKDYSDLLKNVKRIMEVFKKEFDDIKKELKNKTFS